MNPQIFREYDIRGVAERDLTTEVALGIGKAYGSYIRRQNKSKVVLGRDGRVSSKRLHDALLEGMLSSGLHVTDIGECPTPQLYFSIQHLKQDGGIMITGSHNPPDQNGFKMCIGLLSISGATIQELKTWIEKNNFEKGKGSVTTTNTHQAYVDFYKGAFHFKKKIKVVADYGNGMNGMIAPEVFRALGCEVTDLYAEVDCRFPNHPADPSQLETLKELIENVKSKKADVGLAFDGDGDRVGVINEKGEIIPGDELLILYSREILSRKKGAAIIGDVKCSKRLYDDIAAHGGRPIMWKTGHSLIKQKMKDENAELAGEMSGHMFFKDRFFGFDSSLYAACRVLEIIDQNTRPLSALLSDVPKMVSTPEIRIECTDDKKFEVVKKVVNDLKKNYNVNDLDGARVDFPDGWGLVRASNTQPVLVTRFEALNQKRLAEIQELIESKIRQYGGAVKVASH